MNFDKVILEVNEKKVPLNRFLKKLLSKIIFSFASSLKGIEDQEIKKITVEVVLEEIEK